MAAKQQHKKQWPVCVSEYDGEDEINYAELQVWESFCTSRYALTLVTAFPSSCEADPGCNSRSIAPSVHLTSQQLITLQKFCICKSATRLLRSNSAYRNWRLWRATTYLLQQHTVLWIFSILILNVISIVSQNAFLKLDTRCLLLRWRLKDETTCFFYKRYAIYYLMTCLIFTWWY